MLIVNKLGPPGIVLASWLRPFGRLLCDLVVD